MMLNGRVCVLAAVALATGTLSVAATDEMTPEDAIAARQSGLHDLGGAFKGVNDELKKANPSLTLLRQYVQQIDQAAKSQQFWFPRGSGPEAGIETKAKPDIWQRPEEFAKARDAFLAAAAKLVQVAGASDVDAIKAQTRAVGQTCKGCHDPFREQE